MWKRTQSKNLVKEEGGVRFWLDTSWRVSMFHLNMMDLPPVQSGWNSCNSCSVYLALMSLQMYPSNQDPKTNPTRSVRSIRSMSGSCIPAPRSTKCNNIGVLHPHKREGGTCRLGGDDHSQLLSKVSLRAILTLERGVYLFLLGRKDPNFTIERATLYLTQRMEPLPCIGNCENKDITSTI